MDNTGPYISYAELLAELSFGGSTKVSKSNITLSNKTVDGGGDFFDFTVASGDPTPQVGDVILQAGIADCILEVLTTPDRIRVQKTSTDNMIANGPASILRSESVPKYRGETFIKRAMDTIDRDTRQFFNKRSGAYRIEGNNSPIMFFPVPIISINKLLINSTDLELIAGRDQDFEVFNGRELPQDDRWNPKIKINLRSDSIFSGLRSTAKVFLRNTRTEIEGEFGFLEPDGSTPSEIKEATLIKVVDMIEMPVAKTAASTPTGALKRIKVDLHEQEFFEPSSQEQTFQASPNERYNNIIAKYRSTHLIGGSFREVRIENE